MASINTPEWICNLANGSLGLKNSINNITTPRTDKEINFAQWYDLIRQYLLKTLMPNFALYRLKVSQITLPDAYTDYYAYGYEYPVRCLKLLGLGAIDCTRDPPTVESGMILTNNLYADGAPLRFVDDVTDVTRFTPDFTMAFVFVLAKCTALSNTQDPGKKTSMMKDALAEFLNTTAQNAQENKPVRVSHSRFRTARYSRFGGTETKE
jgi:hypothetical protein